MHVAAESGLLDLFFGAALVVASGLTLLASARVILGPTVPDRVVALDTIGTNVVAIAVLFAFVTGESLFITVALVLTIIGFISTVTVAKYVIEGDIIQQ
ncbi:MAG: monovalent cation/H+ antiporter complex subunit F [Halodesulfurarchaeum sp.]